MNKRTDIPDGYTCSFCGNIFKRESAFEKHRCKAMERDEQLKSVQGQVAFGLFNKWMRAKKRSAVNKTTFGESKLFNHFFKFASWKNAVKIPDVDKFISMMVIWDFSPSMWTTDQVYTRYIDFLDNYSTVDDHIRYTYDTLKRVSGVAECPLNQVFDVLEAHMVMEYIRARKLSPWVLIKIPGFKRMVATLNEFQKQKLEQFIRPRHWAAKMRECPEETQLIADFIEKVGL